MSELAIGLKVVARHTECVAVHKMALEDLLREFPDDTENYLACKHNLASAYGRSGQSEAALVMKREVYSGFVSLKGPRHPRTLIAAINLCASLPISVAVPFTREQAKISEQVNGAGHLHTQFFRQNTADALVKESSTLNDAIAAVKISEEVCQAMVRLLGAKHRDSIHSERTAEKSRSNLVDTLGRLDISPEAWNALAAKSAAWDALVAENISLRRENASLRAASPACVTPSSKIPADSESDLD